MSNNSNDYCTNIFNLIITECTKRGLSSGECCLLKMILNKRCINKKDDCTKIKDLLLKTCYNTNISKSQMNKNCILFTKNIYDKC